MKKLIVLTAATSILLVAGGQQQAWAGNKSHNDNDDYRTFRKVVRVLDGLINDGHHKRRNHVYVRTYHRPKKVCYIRGHRKVCTLKRRVCQQCGDRHQYKKYSKRRYNEQYKYRNYR